MKIFDEFIKWAVQHEHIIQQSVSSIIALLVLIGIRMLAGRILLRKVEEPGMRYRMRKTLGYVQFFIAFLVFGRIWLSGFQSLTTILGLISAGIAFALQDIIKSLAGWAFILWRRPFILGDRIQIGDTAGDIIDIRIFQFTILEIGNWVDGDQSTGRVIHIPNGLVFTEKVANFTSGFQFIWNEIHILLTFESDWKKAKSLLSNIANANNISNQEAVRAKLLEASRKYLIYYNNISPIVYTTVKDSGVQFSIRFLTEPRKRRSVEEKIWEQVLNEFAKHKDIDFAYPTVRYYHNKAEGKQANTHQPDSR